MYAHSISGRSRIYNDRTVIHKVEAYVCGQQRRMQRTPDSKRLARKLRVGIWARLGRSDFQVARSVGRNKFAARAIHANTVMGVHCQTVAR